MSDKGKSLEQIEREERLRVALADTQGQDSAVRLEAIKLKMEKRREIARAYRVTLANDEKLAARAGYSGERRQRDFINRYHAYRAAHDDDERMDFFVANRASDQYNQRVRERVDRVERERERETAKK